MSSSSDTANHIEDEIWIIYSGLDGKYTDIHKAFELEAPAIRWCKDQLRELSINSNWPMTTNAVDESGTTLEVEVCMRIHEEEGSSFRQRGFTLAKKAVALVGTNHLPDLIHVVYNKHTLEAVYASTDWKDATEKMGDAGMEFDIKNLELRKGGSAYPATVFV
ncbi:MAG: hypothetical protein L6R41_006916 [Letrouitia leprolyta]|nr:MAG: hypothetical protein L6R41_006916 [Letrouitia leprolyta]